MKKRETVAERRERISAKLEQRRTSNGTPPPDFEDDEITDVIDLSLEDLRKTHTECQRRSREELDRMAEVQKELLES